MCTMLYKVLIVKGDFYKLHTTVQIYVRNYVQHGNLQIYVRNYVQHGNFDTFIIAAECTGLAGFGYESWQEVGGAVV